MGTVGKGTKRCSFSIKIEIYFPHIMSRVRGQTLLKEVPLERQANAFYCTQYMTPFTSFPGQRVTSTCVPLVRANHMHHMWLQRGLGNVVQLNSQVPHKKKMNW